MRDLSESISRVFLGGHCFTYTDRLEALVCLVGYYIDDDFEETERVALTKLNATLHKYSLVDAYVGRINQLFISSKHLTNVNSTIEKLYSQVDPFQDIDTSVDIASLMSYVKRKIIERKDWPKEC